MTQAYFVYKLTCNANGKHYIGASKSPNDRLKQHRAEARRGKDYTLYKAMRKHGVDSFEMTVIYGSLSRHHIFNEMEPYFIKLYESDVRGKGYNITPGGEGKTGPTSEKTKEILRETSKQAWKRKSQVEKDAHATLIRESWMAKLPEQKAEIIATLNKVRNTKSSGDKQSKAAKAQHIAPVLKETHRRATTKANQDPEKRKRIAETAKARWANPNFKDKLKKFYQTEEQKTKRTEASKGKRALEWELTDISGQKLVIKNLAEWCKERGFDDKKMRRVSYGKLKQAYGYTCKSVS